MKRGNQIEPKGSERDREEDDEEVAQRDIRRRAKVVVDRFLSSGQTTRKRIWALWAITYGLLITNWAYHFSYVLNLNFIMR